MISTFECPDEYLHNRKYVCHLKEPFSIISVEGIQIVVIDCYRLGMYPISTRMSIDLSDLCKIYLY
jgi:hypothetical protein